MPVGKYRGLSLQRELLDMVEEWIRKHPEMGYKSLADLVTDALRKRCEELKILTHKPPSLEHFNINQDYIRVIDYRKRVLADVYFRGDKVYCKQCNGENCEHIKYVRKIPKVQRLLRQKGWIIRKGKVLRSPF